MCRLFEFRLCEVRLDEAAHNGCVGSIQVGLSDPDFTFGLHSQILSVRLIDLHGVATPHSTSPALAHVIRIATAALRHWRPDGHVNDVVRGRGREAGGPVPC